MQRTTGREIQVTWARYCWKYLIWRCVHEAQKVIYAPLKKDWKLGSLANTLLPPRSTLGMLYSLFYSPRVKIAFTATPHPFQGKSFLPPRSQPGCLSLSSFILKAGMCSPSVCRNKDTRKSGATGGHRVPQPCSQQTLSLEKSYTGNPARSRGQRPVQGLQHYSQPEAKDETAALSSSHCNNANLLLPYLVNSEKRLEMGTKHQEHRMQADMLLGPPVTRGAANQTAQHKWDGSMRENSQVGNKRSAEVGCNRLVVDPGSKRWWPAPAAPGSWKPAAVETSGLAPRESVEKERGRSLGGWYRTHCKNVALQHPK